MIINRFCRNLFVKNYMKILTYLTFMAVILLFTGLILKSLSILKSGTFFQILFSTKWAPLKQNFGLLPFILASIYVTVLALFLAVPLSVFASLYLSEYCPRSIKNNILSLFDLLAGFPSVIYGIWGVLIIVPVVKNFIAPVFHVSTTGYTLLSGGIVLAVMIFPIIIQISTKVLDCVPNELREASLALGTTKWETIQHVVFKKALPGIMAAIILAASRAIGETIAVLMVVGNVVQVPRSPLNAAYPLPALIANNYGEMMSIPLFDSAIMFAALVLLVIIVIINIFARIILLRMQRRIQL